MENETGVSRWSPRFGRWYVCDKVVHILFMTCTTRFYWLNQNAVIKLDSKAFRNVTKENRVGVIKRTIKFVGTFASRLGLENREIPRLSQYRGTREAFSSSLSVFWTLRLRLHLLNAISFRMPYPFVVSETDSHAVLLWGVFDQTFGSSARVHDRWTFRRENQR